MLATALRELSARGYDAGFDELDAPLGASLTATDKTDWTLEQARAAWKMLGKYRHRLADLGIDYSAIPEPSAALLEAAGHESDRAGVEDGNFVVRFERLAPGPVAEVQRISGARFDA
ncbi:MAG: hypothetical protein ACR2JR_09795, partial [Rubrobacteraceae bacterium]